MTQYTINADDSVLQWLTDERNRVAAINLSNIPSGLSADEAKAFTADNQPLTAQDMLQSLVDARLGLARQSMPTADALLAEKAALEARITQIDALIA